MKRLAHDCLALFAILLFIAMMSSIARLTDGPTDGVNPQLDLAQMGDKP